MSKPNLRAQIFAAQDLKVESVTVPEWGGVEFEMWGLGLDEYSKVIEKSKKENGDIDADKYGIAMLIASARDKESKTNLFSPADRDELAKKSPLIIGRLAAIAMRLCGEGVEAEAQAEKNSETTTGNATPSE